MEENPFIFVSARQRESSTIGAERLSQLRDLDGWQAVSRFTAHRKFQEIILSARVPEYLCNTYVLRHTRAAMMIATGADSAQVQYLLGHSTPKMAQRYLAIADAIRPKITSEILTMGLGA